MEKQWREATAAIKDNRMQDKINTQNLELQKLQQQIMDLKSENQVLKLKLHTSQTDALRFEPNVKPSVEPLK